MAIELFRPGTRVRIPDYMKDYRSPNAVGALCGTVRGVDDSGKHYAVEFDPSTMIVGHGCTRGDGTRLAQSNRGWWFEIVPGSPSHVLVTIETSKFESAVADYIAREIGGQR